MICPLKPRVTVAETVMMVMEAATMMETAGAEKITRKHLFYPPETNPVFIFCMKFVEVGDLF